MAASRSRCRRRPAASDPVPSAARPARCGTLPERRTAVYDDNLSLIPADLLQLSTETAAALGCAWTVKAILSSPLVVHPTGMRVMVHQRDGHVQLTAHVSLSTDPRTPAEKVTARLPLTGHPSTALRAADAIRTRILPRFGCLDAVAALRVLSLPLRDAGIPAIAHGSTGRTTVEYRSRDFASTTAEFQPGERRPLKVVIRSVREGHTHADVSIPHLSVPEAARITASVLPRVYTPVPVPGPPSRRGPPPPCRPAARTDRQARRQQRPPAHRPDRPQRSPQRAAFPVRQGHRHPLMGRRRPAQRAHRHRLRPAVRVRRQLTRPRPPTFRLGCRPP